MTSRSQPPSASEPKRSPNEFLVGVPASRSLLITPCLVLDLDVLEANIAAMAAHCRRSGIALRPHAKTHKSLEIARMQIACGALGVCCATIGEAEILVRGGVRGVLVTSPVVQGSNIERLVALEAQADELMAVVDDPDNAHAIASRAAALGRTMPMLVDVDLGTGRTGTATVGDAIALAKLLRATPGARFVGVQGYAGHLQHIADYAARRELAAEQHAKMAELVDELRREGLDPRIVSGGGTGTHDIDARAGVFTELQAGSYTVMDVEYGDVDAGEGQRFLPALFVRTSVISRNATGMVTTDGGLKRFATDGPRPRIARGAPATAVYGFSGDEHGCIVFASPSETLPLGTAVECVVPHCDPTVNLYDHYHCVRGDDLVAIWPVDARGAY
jgi:3-hydroxy-D-aspartate aldolase